MKDKLLLVGGTSGIGSQLQFDSYDVRSVGSLELDVTRQNCVDEFFQYYLPDALIFLSVYNFDGLVHKLVMDEVQKQVEINVLGLSRVLRAVLPKMRERKSGKIVYVSSILAKRSMKGTAIYSACKSFGERLIEVTALENASYGITANSAQLGYFDAGLMHRISEDVQKFIVDSIPMKRLGTTTEVENLLSFILSNPYLNGATISLAGGLEAN